MYYAADDARYLTPLMECFGEYLITDQLTLSIGTYWPFIEIVQTPEILTFGCQNEANVERDRNDEVPSTSTDPPGHPNPKIQFPILSLLEVGIYGNHGIDDLSLATFLTNNILPVQSRNHLRLHRLHSRHADFFKEIVEAFRKATDPTSLFKKISVSMMSQPNLDDYFQEIGLTKCLESNKFEEIRSDGWKLRVLLSSLIELNVIAPA